MGELNATKVRVMSVAWKIHSSILVAGDIFRISSDPSLSAEQKFVFEADNERARIEEISQRRRRRRRKKEIAG